MKDIIEKHVLKNAIDFCGKANQNAILGRVLADHPELRKDVKEVMKEINSTIKKTEKLSLEEQQKKLHKIAPELLKEKKKEKKEGLKDLPNVGKKFVTRFAPSPSGPLHIGHAYGISLASEYARKYKGTLFLRIEDTNPENIYPAAYKMIEEEAQWITKGNVAKVIVQSDRLGGYYDYAEKLVSIGKAYVCVCDADKARAMKAKGKACPCRELDVKEQQKRYAKMFNEYAEGEAVLRLKTDIENKNPALRDFAIARINEHVHPRTQKEQRVWPLMNFSVAIDDYLLGITHSIRAKEHADNGKKQRIIHDYFGWASPVDVYVGRINFEDLRISASKTRRAIEENKFKGWDDIRLPFIAALRRRGYQPDALIKYAVDVGVSLNDKVVKKSEFFKTINHANKEILDSKANRYFFIEDPVRIKVDGAPTKIAKVPLHPDFHERGMREFKTEGEFLISKKDFDAMEAGKLHRLMECMNVLKKGKKLVFDSEDYVSYRDSKKRGMIVHWLPAKEEAADVSVMLEEGKATGKGEHRLRELKEGTIVQLERFGFCRLDKKDGNNVEFWFTHR